MAHSQWGLKVGLLTPATNLTVESELSNMRVDNVTVSASRIIIDSVDWTSPEGLQNFVEGVNKRLPETIERLQFQPKSLLLGISSSNLWGGLESNQQIKNDIYQQFGISLTTPVDAYVQAQKELGFKKIGVITPYPEIADEKVAEFFAEFGVEVVQQNSFRCTNPIDIGEVSEPDLIQMVRKTDSDECDAILQLGTDLRMARVASISEEFLGKPVLSVNATTWWHYLRQNDIGTRLSGWGSLLSQH